MSHARLRCLLLVAAATLAGCELSAAKKADDRTTIALVLEDATKQMPSESLARIREAITKPLSAAGFRITPDEATSDVICNTAIACTPTTLKRDGQYELCLSLHFWLRTCFQMVRM